MIARATSHRSSTRSVEQPSLAMAKPDSCKWSRIRSVAKPKLPMTPMNPWEVVAPVRPLYDFQWTPYREAVVTAEIVRTFQKEEVSGVNFLPVRTETTLG